MEHGEAGEASGSGCMLQTVALGSVKRVATGASSSSGRRHGVGANRTDGDNNQSRGAAQGNWGKRPRWLRVTGEENRLAMGPARKNKKCFKDLIKDFPTT
jgi:hypothetical protein